MISPVLAWEQKSILEVFLMENPFEKTTWNISKQMHLFSTNRELYDKWKAQYVEEQNKVKEEARREANIAALNTFRRLGVFVHEN